MNDLTKNASDTHCAICQAAPLIGNTDQKYFILNGKKIFLCGLHAKAFYAGIFFGQMDLNSKITDCIASADDMSPSKDLKDQILSLVPMAKHQVNQKAIEIKSSYDFNQKSPRDIYSHLEKHIIGQEIAKQRISLAVFEHYKNIQRSKSLEKHNILMLGPSGSGKTLIANTVASLFDLPFVSVDATGYSPTGFQGADADTMVHDLMFKSGGVNYTTERGVIFIDEIDKLSTHNNQGTKGEAMNYATQSSLLKLIEGKKVKVPMQSMGEPHGTVSVVDTSRMLFMFGGAFNGLAEQVGKLMGYQGRTISISRRDDESQMENSIKSFEILSNAPSDVIIKALIDYGMNTELVGRIPIIVPLAPLTQDQLLKCLTDTPMSPINIAQINFAESNIKLEFEEDFLNEVVLIASRAETGTRALQSLIKKSISKASFDLLGGNYGSKTKKVKIIKDCIINPELYIVN